MIVQHALVLSLSKDTHCAALLLRQAQHEREWVV
jgi:hypothetical protein